ncbi:hypothetical protein JNB_16724 [Janibacter sp. HTCC2649]|uniref:DUF2530 domain-containing protein n=1 Tax=Janibacter sp. HTCC2649 TaxID=313589 RepID=UPI00006711F7|nr:DUF2530 domain-containing protein [Janibacter sp. HTCC2649]EAP97148.1 hypothetical protein JNB_16724 [Janibacter sp. HTCC2649]
MSENAGESVSGPDATSAADAEVLEALQVPTQRIIVIGLGLWVLALLATLVVPALHEGDRSWWPWACVAGFVLGGIGLLYVRRGRGNAHDAG